MRVTVGDPLNVGLVVSTGTLPPGQHKDPAVSLASHPPKYWLGVVVLSPQLTYVHVLPSGSVDPAHTRIGFELGEQVIPLPSVAVQLPEEPVQFNGSLVQ